MTSFPRWGTAPAAAALLIALLAAPGCILLMKGEEIETVDPADPPARVSVPLKAHLADGSVAVFADGATFEADTLRGAGDRYSLTLETRMSVQSLPLDSVIAIETYRESVRTGSSIAASVLATVPSTMVLAVAAFGSCPTVYSQPDSAHTGTRVLEAESFSNSIAPMLEIRDVDVLEAQPDDSGALTLEVRNEALETHYINHLELVEARHAAGEQAFPTGDGRAWIVGGLQRPRAATDASGRDLTAVFDQTDGRAYRTPIDRLKARVSSPAPPDRALTEHVDIAFQAPDADSAAVLLTLRNSLLNTVLFYEYMLSSQGAHSLTWLGKDLNVISTVMELSDFYARRMGLRVQVRTESGYETVARVREVGPIAWSHEAVPVPVPRGADSLHIRLSFVPDAWRVDHVALAGEVRRAEVRRHALTSVRLGDRTALPSDSAHRRLAHPDHAYAVTLPTDRFWATFQPGPVTRGLSRSFFLAAQGYYTEWIRRDWLRDSPETPGLQVSDEVLIDALDRWTRSRAEWEARFEASKLPVQ